VGRGDEERHAPADRVGVEELGAGGDADSVKGEEEAHPPVRCKGGSDLPTPSADTPASDDTFHFSSGWNQLSEDVSQP